MGNIIIGIDASRNRSGGAIAHLTGILSEEDPRRQGIKEVHLWSYKRLLDQVPERPWVIKHNPPELEASLLEQVWWQYRTLQKEANSAGCDVLFATDATTVSRFRPLVVMSQDLLSYETGAMKSFGFGKARLRLIAILLVQNMAMKRADGVIYLTRYASRVIQSATGKLARTTIIPHGVGCAFRNRMIVRQWPSGAGWPIQCLYVSNVAPYKHQWNVVRATGMLRKRGIEIRLVLVGESGGPAQRLLNKEIVACDPEGNFVDTLGAVEHERVAALMAGANIFVFASSCENLPVTLLEAMANGLPIACSDRGPMPEVLEDGGVYFNPEDPASIAEAIERIVKDEDLRLSIAKRAKELSERYSWAKCASATWEFIKSTKRD